MKLIPYNITDYKKLILEDYYYIDKTTYLNELQDTGPNIVYLRPRRFGKTLFTSMMYYYYDINSAYLYDKLFKNTYIYTHQVPITRDGEKVYLRNSYYVLKFDFSSMSEDITTKVKNTNQLTEDFNEKLDDAFDSFITHYGFEYENFNASTPANKLSKFLRYITRLKLDNKLYIIIDEYDNFTNSILRDNAEDFLNIVGNNGFVKNFYALIKSKLGVLIDRVFITGVCSVSLDSMTSGFNVATNITTYDKYNEMTALTYKEVKKLIETCVPKDKQKETFDIIKENYDGYKFSENGDLVFNPNLTMYYLSKLLDTGMPPKNLLDNNIISSYTKIRNIVQLFNNEYYREILDTLFEKGTIEEELSESFDLNERDLEKKDIISLLFYFGYLTISSSEISKIFEYRIPNKIISTVYSSYYIAMQKEKNIKIPSEGETKAIIALFKDGNIVPYLDLISISIKQSADRMNTKFKELDLQYLIYHSLNMHEEINIRGEFPSNQNFIDLMIFKNEHCKYNIMIELKYIRKCEYTESLFNKKMNDGIEQIHRYKNDERIPKDNIKYYVVVFTGSEYKIKEL